MAELPEKLNTSLLAGLLRVPTTGSDRKIQLGTLLLLAILSLSPFANKAVHIDDLLFIDMGNMFSHANNYYGESYTVYGETYDSLLRASHSPLVVPLSIFLVKKTFPTGGETALHLFFLSFAVGSLIFTYLLCLRFNAPPFLISAGLLFSPPFLILSQSLMTDVATYCFVTGSMVFFIRAVDRADKRALAFAIILFSLAIGCGFQSLIFHAMFLAYVVLNQPGRIAYVFAMGLSVLPYFIWYGYHISLHRELATDLSYYSSLLDAMGQRMKIPYYISQLSTAFLAPVGFIFAVWQRKHMKTALVSLVLTGVLFPKLFSPVLGDYTLAKKLVFCGGVFFSFLGFAMILQNAYLIVVGDQADKQEKSDTIFLLLNLIIFIPICFVFTPFATTRYLLPIIGVVYILIFRHTATIRPWIATAAIVVCAAMSMWTAKADYDLAEIYRKFATESAQVFPEKERVWFIGEWGFRYYMSQAGYRYLSKDSDIKAGDMIIDPTIVARMSLGQVHRPLQLKKVIAYPGNLLKTLHFGTHAGFWSQGWGLMPFWPSRQPTEEFKVYEVLG